MNELTIAAWTGLLAGLAHVYVGADHLAALMPLAAGRRLKAAWLGLRWGVGHSVGVVIVAILLLAGREALKGRDIVDLEPVGEWGERLVGVLLIGLGALGIRAAARHKLHVHSHNHEGAGEHAHLHVHSGNGHGTEAGTAAHSHLHSHAALLAGTLHGTAGMAHLMGVLPALGLPLKSSFVYLGCFALGSVVAMTGFSAVFGVITARLGDRFPRMIKGSMYAAAAICIVVGAAWIALPLAGIELP